MRELLTPRWLGRHLLALAGVAACLLAGVWQWQRAAAGNTLSWAYTAEWPLFALFVVFVWVRAIRDSRRSPDEVAKPAQEPLRLRTAAPIGPTDDEDPQLAAYNRYLAWLAADPDRRPSDYPG